MLGLFATHKRSNAVRVEFQISPRSKILSQVSTLGELKKKFPELEFVKYIYVDPADGLLKGVNPPDTVPLVEKANLTVSGDLNSIIKLSELATS